MTRVEMSLFKASQAIYDLDDRLLVVEANNAHDVEYRLAALERTLRNRYPTPEEGYQDVLKRLSALDNDVVALDRAQVEQARRQKLTDEWLLLHEVRYEETYKNVTKIEERLATLEAATSRRRHAKVHIDALCLTTSHKEVEPPAPRSSPSEDHLFGLLHGWFNAEKVSGYNTFEVRHLANFLWRRLQDDPKALAAAALGSETP